MARRWFVRFVFAGIAGIALAARAVSASAEPALAGGEEPFSFAAIDSMARASVPIACAADVQGRLGVRNINGSGFFINRNGDFVTAQHVVAALSGCIPAIYVPRAGWSFNDESVDAKWYRISSCDQDASVDIAVCHLNANPFTDPAVHTALATVAFDVGAKPEGTPVAFTSFALNNVHPITSVGIVAGYFWENHQRYLLVDKGAWYGASGSALYGGDGRVIGIVLQAGMCAATEGSCRYDGLTFAGTADLIDRFLTSHGVAHQV